MEYELVWVGRGRDKLLAELAERYFARLRRTTSLTTRHVAETRGRGLSPEEARTEEARRLRTALERSSRRSAGGRRRLVALDERGDLVSSRELARWLGELRERGTARVTFLIGGDEGLDPDLVREADRVLALSPMTLTHELARVVLAEQLYRATAILNGHPYHRD